MNSHNTVELPPQGLEIIKRIKDEVSKVIVGQYEVVDSLLIGLISNQHILLEGVPGLAKTLLINTLGEAIGAKAGRIQFTPDLLPADLTGTMIYNPQKGDFSVKKGPVFTNMLLADEINRAPAKVQSALLEAMQERQITIGETSYPLSDPFLVLATQNPVEQEGTYPLPEAQVDRFMLKVLVNYPSKEDELAILRAQSCTSKRPKAQAVCQLEDIKALRSLWEGIYMDEKLERYIVDLIAETRLKNPLIQFGSSPRGTIFLSQAAKAYALIKGRSYVSPEDIKAVAPSVLRHRVVISYEAEAEGLSSDDLIQTLLDRVKIL